MADAGLPVDCRSTGSLLAKEPLELRSTASRPIQQRKHSFLLSVDRPSRPKRYREQNISFPVDRYEGRSTDRHAQPVHVWTQQPVDCRSTGLPEIVIFWADFWVRKICKKSLKNSGIKCYAELCLYTCFKHVFEDIKLWVHVCINQGINLEINIFKNIETFKTSVCANPRAKFHIFYL